MVFIIEGIPAKFLSTDTKMTEGLYTGLNFHKRKYLLCCSYNPNKKRNQESPGSVTEKFRFTFIRIPTHYLVWRF